MPRRGLGLALMLLVLLGSTHAAGAHPRLDPVPLPAAVETVEPGASGNFLVSGAPVPNPAPLWLALALMMTLVVAGRRSPRRAAALVFVGLLLILAFETGLHSVHHVGDPEAGCVVAAISAHVAGVAGANADIVPTLLVAAESPAVADQGALPARQFRPDEGRAPPA